MKPTTTWIVIADQGSAKIMQAVGIGNGISPVEGMSFNGPEKKVFAKPKGRSFRSFSSSRDTHEPHHKEQLEFAGQIIAELEAARREQRFDRLILCAAPEMLGNLRTTLTPELEATLYGTLPKDLVNTPTAKLSRHLETLLAI